MNHDTDLHRFSRRRFLQGTAMFGLLAGLESLAPAFAWDRTGNLDAKRTTAGNADVFDLTIRRSPLTIGGRAANPITINGSVPGPLIRLREGRDAILRVTNALDEDTSIHWHGILLPPEMDGVPGVSFAGIRPGETFEYRYPVRQSGTYWYHSHSGLQEQLGHYGPLVIDPAEPEPFAYDRDYVVMLSDWTFDDPHHVFANLKKAEGYYNYQKRTVRDFFQDVSTKGWKRAWQDWAMWGQMRMSSRDILDVTGSEYTYLINGLPTESNWTALFRPGEKVRLRFINGSAMTFFDVRIPGTRMTVVAADGQNVAPVPVDEFRIGVAETYDVIVEPQDERAYAIFAEAMDRSGFVRATLAPREGMVAPIPERRTKVVERGMESMGMDHSMHGMDAGMDHSMHGMGTDHAAMGHGAPGGGAMDHSAMGSGGGAMDHSAMEMGSGAATMDHSTMPMGPGAETGTAAGAGGMDHSGMSTGSGAGGMDHSGMAMGSGAQAMDHSGMDHSAMGHGAGAAGRAPMAAGAAAAGMAMGSTAGHGQAEWVLAGRKVTHGADNHGPGAAMVAMNPQYRMDDPGVGFEDVTHKVLVYDDLRALQPWPDRRPPERELELHLTGNMERYMWSFDGKKFSEVDYIRFHHGERLRLILVNDTMMDHPIHLHGMWMELENRHGDYRPRKHTISLKPGEMLSALITADAPGDWAFHCHLLYHMKAGMFRVVTVA